jgi:hypothetical protein
MPRRILESKTHATSEVPPPGASFDTDTAERAARKPKRARQERDEATSEVRRRRIAEIAYYRAERRGFRDGSALEDWLVAERAVDADDDPFDL